MEFKFSFTIKFWRKTSYCCWILWAQTSQWF